MGDALMWDSAEEIVKSVLHAFRLRDVPLILDGFTSDAEVIFGAMDPLRGHAEIERFLTARFARQLNYRLEKELRMVDGNRMAVAWWGWWDDAVTQRPMRGKGVEVWDIRNGLLSRWEAAFNPVAVDDDPAAALGIL
jgi:uncharacterized protein